MIGQDAIEAVYSICNTSSKMDLHIHRPMEKPFFYENSKQYGRSILVSELSHLCVLYTTKSSVLADPGSLKIVISSIWLELIMLTDMSHWLQLHLHSM